jgi:hypothetical protein
VLLITCDSLSAGGQQLQKSTREQSATAVNMGDNKEEIEVVGQNFVCCLLGELIQQYAEKLGNYGWGIKGGWQSDI